MIMRSFSLLFPASLLALAASAGAQQLPYPRPDPASVNTVQVTAPARVAWIRLEEAKQIGGEYEMSNGWFMRVETGSQHIDATIDEQKPIRLVKVARNQFASGDGSVKMVFNQGMSGDEMTMSYVPDRALAQVVVLSSRMAQR
jgi:hypothetical protein